jgi:UMF1 family MFS transporter
MKYLAARIIFADGIVALLSLGGVYTSGVLGWDGGEVALYGIYASIFGFVGGFLAGSLDKALGARRSIMLELAVLCVGIVIALGVTQTSIFYGLIPSGHVVHGLPIFNTLSDVFYLGLIAVIAGAAAACISSSRYMMVVLAPKERISEFFGLYALSSTATVWLGPMLTEFATRVSGDQRIGFSPVLLLLATGLALMFTLKGDKTAPGAAPSAGH